jgi:membrane protease YdiL (CAAX protease family)
LSQSEQSPPSISAEAIATINLASLSPWSVIRDPVIDLAAVVGVLIAAGVVIGLLTIWQKTGHSQSISPRLIAGFDSLTELSLLYFGFRRLRVNRRKGVILKLFEGNAWRGVLCGISIGIAMITFSVIYEIAVQKVLHLSSLPNPLQILREVKGNPLLSLALVLTISILAPTCEEFFFRANIFGSAQAINRTWLGAVVASVLFAFAHLNLVLSPYYILFSIATCWLFTRYRTIIAPIAAHMTVNTVACFAVLLR